MKGYSTSTNNIKRWAQRKGWFCQRPGYESHLLLDGGKLTVPMSEYKLFLKIVGDNLDAGVKNFITERRTPIFRMHTDLDIIEPNDNPMTLERLRSWIDQIQSVIVDFFCNDTHPECKKCGLKDAITGRSLDRLSVLVCIAPLKRDVSKNKELWTKTGVHLIWPWLYVTDEQAINLRKGWIQSFETKYGKRGGHNTWEEVFDLCVYQHNGLRMVGSDKIEPCPACKRKKAKNHMCPLGLCDGITGSVATDRVYRVVDAYTGSGKKSSKLLKAATADGYVEVSLTSIRTSAKTALPLTFPDWFDPNFFYDEEESHRQIFNPTAADRKKRREALGHLPENIASARELGILQAPKIPKEDERLKIVQKWIRNSGLPDRFRIPGVYRKTQIVDMVRVEGKYGSSHYYFARTDSWFCQNKGAEHSSANIYFLINEKGLYQKCFCRCPTTDGRRDGLSKDYKSSPREMPPRVREILFPELHYVISRGQQIVSTEHVHTTAELDLEKRIALQKAKRYKINIALAQKKARMKAKFEERFESKKED